MDVIETPRLVLRPFREGDVDDVFAYARDPRVGPQAGWPPHRSRAESLEIIRTIFSAPGVAALVLKQTGRVVGSAGFEDRHSDRLPGPDDEIGYALSPACWGQGIGWRRGPGQVGQDLSQRAELHPLIALQELLEGLQNTHSIPPPR